MPIPPDLKYTLAALGREDFAELIREVDDLNSGRLEHLTRVIKNSPNHVLHTVLSVVEILGKAIGHIDTAVTYVDPDSGDDVKEELRTAAQKIRGTQITLRQLLGDKE